MPDPSNDSVQNDAPIHNASDYRALSRAELESALSTCQRRLHENSRRFEISLRGSCICVFLQNLDFEYEWIHNPPTGFETNDLIGRRDEDFLEANECARFDALKNAALQANAPRRGEVRISDGNRRRHFDVLIEPYHDIDDDLIGLLGVAVETTE